MLMVVSIMASDEKGETLAQGMETTHPEMEFSNFTMNTNIAWSSQVIWQRTLCERV